MSIPHFYEAQSRILSSLYPNATPPLSISYERFNELKDEISKLLGNIVNGVPIDDRYYSIHNSKNHVSLVIPVGSSAKPLNIDPLIRWLENYGCTSRSVCNTEDGNGYLITEIEIVVMNPR